MHTEQSPRSRELISIVIPMYNEAEGVSQLQPRLESLQACWPDVDLEFVFVDDGSSDGTLGALSRAFAHKPLCRFAVHRENRGVGAAFRTGFQYARGSVVCTIDSDCSYGPEELRALVSALRDERADIAVASPYHPEGHVKYVPRWRLGLSQTCSWIYRLVAPVRLYTYTSIFRAYQKSAVELLSFEEDGFVSAAEMLIRAAESGYTIVEVPMTLHARKVGQTKMKVLRTIRGHLRLIASTALRRLQRSLGLARIVRSECDRGRRVGVPADRF